MYEPVSKVDGSRFLGGTDRKASRRPCVSARALFPNSAADRARGFAGVFVVTWLAQLERSRHCPKRNGQTVPAIDRHNSQRKVDQLFLGKVLANVLVHFIRHVIDADQGERFGPRQCRTFSFRVGTETHARRSSRTGAVRFRRAI